MHFHLIGVCGTGMGSLAGLLAEQGHRVTGSDVSFYPPMSEALERWGIKTYRGFDSAHLEPTPDRIVVGNVCRSDNPEARFAIDRGIPTSSLPTVLEEIFIRDRLSCVVSGTHGKTTTASLLAYLLDRNGKRPGFFIGGIPNNFEHSFRAAEPGHAFVIEGDEYDSAFFEKMPKFWKYKPKVAVINAIEHDHVDIYPTPDDYRQAFVEFVNRIPFDGLLIANAADEEVRQVSSLARCRVRTFGLDSDDCKGNTPNWVAAPQSPRYDHHPFNLYIDNKLYGEVVSPMVGNHNIRNVLAAMMMATEGISIEIDGLVKELAGFKGVRRRQQLRGIVSDIRVYDDFAHHPTSVTATLRSLKQRHKNGQLIAIFEPRSATASRRLHQMLYADAFDSADVVLLAPVARQELPEDSRLDIEKIAKTLASKGISAEAFTHIDHIIDRVVQIASPGDTIIAMSNGAFGNIHERLLSQLMIPEK